jgi:hypothetical protein
MPEFRKISGKLYATLNAKERDAMDRAVREEAMAALAEYDRKHVREVDAIILLELRRLTGFGYDRLKRFYFGFGAGINALLERYELPQEDDVWLATRQLREIGIDLDAWEREREEAERNVRTGKTD